MESILEKRNTMECVSFKTFLPHFIPTMQLKIRPPLHTYCAAKSQSNWEPEYQVPSDNSCKVVGKILQRRGPQKGNPKRCILTLFKSLADPLSMYTWGRLQAAQLRIKQLSIYFCCTMKNTEFGISVQPSESTTTILVCSDYYNKYR